MQNEEFESWMLERRPIMKLIRKIKTIKMTGYCSECSFKEKIDLGPKDGGYYECHLTGKTINIKGKCCLDNPKEYDGKSLYEAIL